MKRIAVITSALLYICSVSAQGQTSAIEFGNETNDTTRLTSILIDEVAASSPRQNAQSFIAGIGERFIDTPYKAGTLDGSPERLRVNLDGMDCTTYVENVVALAITAAERRSSWRDFVYNLEKLRYRGGRMNGYASRLHYITDWALDNNTRGLIREVTDRVGNSNSMVKSLDWITAHRNDYPALADQTVYDEMKHVEGGYRGHKTPYIKSSAVGGAKLEDGDIVALVSKKDGLDVSHVGIIKIIKGKAHLMHASSTAGKVTIEQKPLADYLRRLRDVAGIRVFRLMGD